MTTDRKARRDRRAANHRRNEQKRADAKGMYDEVSRLQAKRWLKKYYKRGIGRTGNDE